MPCLDNVCGTGVWVGPKPGDPDNNVTLTATPAFGGVDISWTYPALNPAAVSHTILYRGLLEDFLSAVKHQVVSGGFFYDKIDAAIRYYYWIEIVSVNDTHGEIIGPVTALARPTIDQLLEQMTGRIDLGILANSLKTEIARIQTGVDGLNLEINDRLASNQGLMLALAAVQGNIDEAMTYVSQEVTQRTTGDAALVEQINLLYASVGEGTAAAILEEKTLRIAADLAIASDVTTVATTLNGDVASGQIGLVAEVDAMDDTVSSMYTAKLTVNGLVGGFGLSNDGAEVEAGFDVDTFWVGRTDTDKRKPFIVVGDETFIDEAVINQLTFSKLRSTDGAVVVEDGRLKAQYVDATNLNVVNGTFSGELFAATGSFSGTLTAGVIEQSMSGPAPLYYTNAGSYSTTVPAGTTSCRVTVLGGGGGGGGGGGAMSEGGTNGQHGANGSAGNSSSVSGVVSLTSAGGGGGGGGAAPPEFPATGYGGSIGGQAAPVDSSAGGAGGTAMGTSGGAGGGAFTTGCGGGGGGRASIVTAQFSGLTPGGTVNITVGTGGTGGAGGTSTQGGGGYTGVAGSPGSKGLVVLEFFSGASVVSNVRYGNLISWLDSNIAGGVPSNAR